MDIFLSGQCYYQRGPVFCTYLLFVFFKQVESAVKL